MLDSDLLQKYAQQHCEDSFRELVTRHGPLVSATAYRQLNHLQLAEEVTQNVFTALATKASHLSRHPSLAGWLHRATQLESAMTKRREIRRLRREAKAALEQATSIQHANIDALPITAALDEAILSLSEKDQAMIFARFYDGLSMRELAERVDVGEKTAQKRVERAVSRLRKVLGAAGVGLPMTSLQAHLVVGAPSTPWASICQHALEASASKTASVGFINLPIILGVTTLGLVSIGIWLQVADSSPTAPAALASDKRSVAALPAPVLRIDDLVAIYRLSPTEREEALVRLTEYLETRHEQAYLLSLFERWSTLDPKRSLITLAQLGDHRDYLFSQIASEPLLAWLRHDAREALAWMEGYDRGRTKYESDLGDTLIDTTAQWYAGRDVEQAIVWLLERRVLTSTSYEHLAAALKNQGWEDSLRLVGSLPEDGARQILFEIENAAGEVNLGYLIPAAEGKRTVEAGETLAYTILPGARRGLLIESMLKRWLDEAAPEQLADQALTLPPKSSRDTLVGMILERWARQDTKAAIAWYLDAFETDSSPWRLALSGILRGLSTDDVQSVWEIWNNQSDDRWHTVRNTVANHLARHQKIHSMLARIVAVEDPALRSRSLRLCGNALLLKGRSCDQVSQALSSLSLTPRDRQDVITAVAESSLTFGASPHQAWASWLVEHSEEAFVERNVSAFVEQWAPQAPNKVVTWLNALEESPTRNAAVEGFVRAIWLFDKEAAVTWIDEIANREQREALLASLTKPQVGRLLPNN